MCNHPHVHMTRPDGVADRFDSDLLPLVNLLFARGVIERFSCQGDPFFVDQTRYEARDHRAYIMVESTPEAYTFLADLATSFPAFREGPRSWSIEIDQEPLRKFMPVERHNPNPRITFRFPHQDIQKLVNWMMIKQDLEEFIGMVSATFDRAQQEAIEAMIKEQNDGKN